MANSMTTSLNQCQTTSSPSKYDDTDRVRQRMDELRKHHHESNDIYNRTQPIIDGQIHDETMKYLKSGQVNGTKAKNQKPRAPKRQRTAANGAQPAGIQQQPLPQQTQLQASQPHPPQQQMFEPTYPPTNGIYQHNTEQQHMQSRPQYQSQQVYSRYPPQTIRATQPPSQASHSHHPLPSQAAPTQAATQHHIANHQPVDQPNQYVTQQLPNQQHYTPPHPNHIHSQPAPQQQQQQQPQPPQQHNNLISHPNYHQSQQFPMNSQQRHRQAPHPQNHHQHHHMHPHQQLQQYQHYSSLPNDLDFNLQAGLECDIDSLIKHEMSVEGQLNFDHDLLLKLDNHYQPNYNH